MKLTILGSGSVKAPPVYGCDCRACARARDDGAYRRRPSSALLETEGFSVLIDAGLPDLDQRFPPGTLSHILLTHYHMDHVQGLFHLRWGENASIQAIGPDDTLGCGDLFKHPGIFDFSTKARPFQPLRLGPLFITPLPLVHSKPTLGYLFERNGKRLAYLTDTVGIQCDALDYLRASGVDLLVLDCTSPPGECEPDNHNDIPMALEIHQATGAARTLLTHISHDLDVWLDSHTCELPAGVTAARDGMVVSLS